MISKLEQEKVFYGDINSNNSIFIGGFESFSIVDFPEKISAVLFLKGCPLRCPFCYNIHLQKLDKKSDYDWVEVKTFLEKRKKVLDAVVFSGGEPLIQKSIKSAIKEVKSMGYKIGLHTCGCYPEVLKDILADINWIGFDIKATFVREHYKKAVGGIDNLDKVSQSLDIIIDSGIDFETRTTCDPRILDINDIYKIADFLKNKGVKNYNLQRYRQIFGDNTPDDQCDKFFHDENLEIFLRKNFEKFELRK